jgi:hypothetical protein
MKVALVVVAIMGLAGSVSAQQRTIVSASGRASYCTAHPEDSLNCVSLRTTTGVLGMARLCPELSQRDQDRKRSPASFLAIEGVDDEHFEEFRLCKLSDDEMDALIKFYYSRMTTRSYYDTKSREPNKIYVALDAAVDDTPDIVISDFRNELRSIPDVELTNDTHADFRVSVSAIRADAGGKSLGYAIAVQLIETYKEPADLGSTKYLPVVVYSSIATTGTDSASVNEPIRDDVAHFNNKHFEEFRSVWPYK